MVNIVSLAIGLVGLYKAFGWHFGEPVL
jgi:hypothetical protein